MEKNTNSSRMGVNLSIKKFGPEIFNLYLTVNFLSNKHTNISMSAGQKNLFTAVACGLAACVAVKVYCDRWGAKHASRLQRNDK